MQLTNTPEDETRPSINGKWVVYEEDSSGEEKVNMRLLHLDSLAAIQLTNADSDKEKPSIASGKLVWTDYRNGFRQAMVGSLPDLQPVYSNHNSVAVTDGMAANQGDAYTLLKLWNEQAGVSAITRYTALLPQPAAETASWESGGPVGTNFNLEAGNFLWVRFDSAKILDLGLGACTSLDLGAGTNVFSYSCFPDNYTSYRLIRELGTANVKALRILDAGTGRWRTASVSEGQIVGDDFIIPNIAVVMIEMNTSVGPWSPGEAL